MIMTRILSAALAEARDATRTTGRLIVVRNDYGMYHVVPLYLPGTDRVDHGYAALGTLVDESLPPGFCLEAWPGRAVQR